MSEYSYLPNDALHKQRAIHLRNLEILYERRGKSGGDVALYVVNQIRDEEAEIAAIDSELQHRGIILSQQPSAEASSTPPALAPTPPIAAPSHVTVPTAADVQAPTSTTSAASRNGSPFVVGPALRPDQPLFGRNESLRFLTDNLAKGSPVNIVGERRMGKTSLLHHWLAHHQRYLPAISGQKPLHYAKVDLQTHLSNAEHFYGRAARELLTGLKLTEPALRTLYERLQTQVKLDADEFERVLQQINQRVRPVLVVDEFQRLLEPDMSSGFPFPGFFNNLRSLLTADLLTMVVASPLKLSEHEATHPSHMTSTFPSYFQVYRLPLLDDAAAEALLTQPSPHPLALHEVGEARRWAQGHPCLLQAAGQAYYDMHAAGRTTSWMQQQREAFKHNNCTASRPRPESIAPPHQRHGLLRFLHSIFVAAPMRVGRLAQKLGATLDDMAAWIIGMVVIIVIALLIAGAVTGRDVWSVMKHALGLQ